jgi:hypothetical protein
VLLDDSDIRAGVSACARSYARPMRLERADDPERQIQAANKAAQFTIERARRYVEDHVVHDAFTDPTAEELQHAPHGDDILATLVTLPDPVLFIRATRDALTAWLDERAAEIGGPTSKTPVGWPWDTWPT